MPSGLSSIFTKQLALKKTTAKDKSYGAAKVTANNRPWFRNYLSDAEAPATTLSLADTERVTFHLEREIYGITSNKQKGFKKESSIDLSECEVWWEAIGIQVLRILIEQCVIRFATPMRNFLSHILKLTGRRCCCEHFMADISEWLHSDNMKEP
jgi:CRISPR/Cas system Type II protein with McrA/HNH and RuvC-like nuclease domain